MADFDPASIDGNDTAIKGASTGAFIGNIGDSIKVRTEMLGTTVLYSGTATTSGTLIPGSVGKYIVGISIRCRVDQPTATRLEYSFDNTVFHRLKVGEAREEEPINISQVKVRAAGSLSTAIYEISINYSDLP